MEFADTPWNKYRSLKIKPSEAYLKAFWSLIKPSETPDTPWNDLKHLSQIFTNSTSFEMHCILSRNLFAIIVDFP